MYPNIRRYKQTAIFIANGNRTIGRVTRRLSKPEIRLNAILYLLKLQCSVIKPKALQSTVLFMFAIETDFFMRILWYTDCCRTQLYTLVSFICSAKAIAIVAKAWNKVGSNPTHNHSNCLSKYLAVDSQLCAIGINGSQNLCL